MIRVGSVLHGYCGGEFNLSRHDCKRVEAIGADWVVVRYIPTYGPARPDFADGLYALEDLERHLIPDPDEECTCGGL